MMILIYEIIVI